MNRLIQTVKYCKQFENIPMHDRYEKGCKKCTHTELCDILPCNPADIDLLKLGRLYQEDVKSITQDEMQEDNKALVELLKRFEKDSEKLGKVRDVILNQNIVSHYDGLSVKLNMIAKITGE